ncbi:hypothetical protein [Bacillus suaedae]|uniref:Uncharacterized protein n=1 Tax=Halalkalibacter suaedae TaxID=2822140 RepID=A0A940WWE7_9BACI|nr:hypothetical protein [Bacillus suaedae]MBP3953660.1 hypothetical protein [Bacillus suaedae]
MSNFFWYMILVAIGVFLILFTFYKKKNILNHISFLLSTVSLAYLGEVIILFVFEGYRYKTGLLVDSVESDIIGHLLLNGIFWGSLFLIVSVFQLRYYWIFVISVLLMLIEVLFIRLGLYTQNWWETYMTGILAIFLLSCTKKWYSSLFYKPNKYLRLFSFYLIAWVVLVGPSLLLMVFGKHHFGLGLSENHYLDHVFFGVPYNLFLSFICFIFIVYLKNPYWKLAPFIIIITLDFVLLNLNIATFFEGWNLFYLGQVRYLCLVLFILLERNTLHLSKTTEAK